MLDCLCGNDWNTVEINLEFNGHKLFKVVFKRQSDSGTLHSQLHIIHTVWTLIILTSYGMVADRTDLMACSHIILTWWHGHWSASSDRRSVGNPACHEESDRGQGRVWPWGSHQRSTWLASRHQAIAWCASGHQCETVCAPRFLYHYTCRLSTKQNKKCMYIYVLLHNERRPFIFYVIH